MNLSEALDAALPEIPKARLTRERPPRLDPDLVVREDVLDGERVVGILQRGKNNFFRFEPAQWDLAQLFDGVRSYDEIAAEYSAHSGFEYTAAEIEAFATNLDADDFWYKTPQEKNIAYNQRLMSQRGRRASRKSKINLAHISFSAWDPDRYFTWLDGVAGRLIYSPWSLLFALALFAFETTVFVAKWNVLGPDIPLYFNFANKSFADIAEFWVLLFALGFIHETAHGLTCKHYGGEVHSMGLMLLYLTPAFFVDVTESWVTATRIQRLATVIAGIWIEMMVCGLAMIVWTNTQPSQFLHDFSYKVILITGIAVIVLNLNPLLKLDGYYFLTELIGAPELKEKSTAFVSGWFQKKVLRLPVEVPPIPRRRVPLFTLYALASGAYSYVMLYFFLRFAYNLSSKLMAEFALIPVGVLAYFMFRSRLRSLKSVVKRLWAHNFGSGFRPGWRWVAVGVAVLVLVFAPIFRDRDDAYFVIESLNPATLHAAVAGEVEAVFVQEGQRVVEGQTLLRMSSRDAAALRSDAEAQGSTASFAAFESEMEGRSIGAAAAGGQAADRSRQLAAEAEISLIVRAPANGVVLTADPAALLHQQVASGQTLLSLAGDSASGLGGAIHLFVPATALSRVHAGADVSLALPGRFATVHLPLRGFDGAAVALPAGLVPRQEYKGIGLPTFYSAHLMLPADAPRVALGAGGEAKIFGVRRSLFSRFVTIVLNNARAHVW